MSKLSPSWHVVINGEDHAIVTKTDGGIYWVKDVPATTMATSGAHWVTDSSGSKMHFDLYRDKRKWDAVTLEDCIVRREAIGPEGATFAMSGYSAYSVVPLDRSIHSLSHSAASGVVRVRPNASGEVIVAVYEPPGSDPKWRARTSSSGP